jgi:hypothetical protein
MTTSFDAKRINVDMSLLNESQRFAQQIKQIEPILNSSCNKGLSEISLGKIKEILQGKKIDTACRGRNRYR